MLSKLYQAPLKFGGGTSNLWGGINRDYTSQPTSFEPDGLFFNSARTALLFVLKNLPSDFGNKVIVTSFTCDAVTDSVLASGKELILIDIQKDLSFNYSDIIREYQDGARIIIVQNTMGKIGLSPAEILSLIEIGIFVIVDNSLAYGTIHKGIDVTSMGNISLESFEVSKTFTCGWGGRILLNDLRSEEIERFIHEYKKVPSMPRIEGLRERLQVDISTKYIKKYYRFGFLIWFFFYGLGIFRKSKVKQNQLNNRLFKLNKYNAPIIKTLFSQKHILFKSADKSYRTINSLRLTHGLLSLPESKYGSPEIIVSPRYPILLRKPFDQYLIDLFEKNKIDLGRWFDRIPEHKFGVSTYENTKFLNSHIINVPSHFSLTSNDIQRINDLFMDMKLAKY